MLDSPPFEDKRMEIRGGRFGRCWDMKDRYDEYSRQSKEFANCQKWREGKIMDCGNKQIELHK